MSATNSTTNYALPIFIGTDKPAWLVDWNGAMTAIDAAIKGVDTDVQSAIVDISGLSSTVASHTSSIATISGQITVITTNLNTATGNINTINSLIGNGTPTTTDQTIIGAINELHADQGNLADLTTPAASLVAAINAIAAGGAVAASAVSYNNTVSGLTATNVQAAIDELKADMPSIKNDFGNMVDITAYTQSNPYTFPSDGYVVLLSGTAYSSIVVYGSVSSYDNDKNVQMRAAAVNNIAVSTALFVRKGMRAYTFDMTDGSARFIPFA